ncbi:MAG: TolC family protein [Neisseria sp.]|uniref:efflux transporter outer membrane subunit n=1 Tax=Neisseria sp. TaxID=192066 RepID=UPI0026DAD102|nr:TolC family protein [Neisseria sp.]MDO4640243.1 TolC family protein [Neisseria sp.]
MTSKSLLFTGSILTLLLAACQNTRIPLDSEIQLPQAFEASATAKGSEEIGSWWQQWHDPVLSNLIEQGLRQNHDIRIARSRLQEARANTRLAEADKGPSANLSAKGSRMNSRINNPLNEQIRSALGQNPQAAALSADHFSLKGNSLTGGLTASWEPDIFGQKRSDADAAYYAQMGAQEQVYGAQMLVAAEIADNYFKARAAQMRLKTAENTIITLQRMLRYVEGRFKAGQTTAYEIEQVRTQLTSAQAKQSTINAEYAAYVRNIAVLTGQTSQGFTLPISQINILANQPAAPSGQTPQGLLERRPDIRANAAQVNAYAAKLASAKADLLPRFSINFLGQGTISIDSASDLKGWGSLLSANIQVPIFTNGRIKANIDAADARLKTALLQYDQTLLKALSEVDTAYQTENAQGRQSILLSSAYKQAAKQATDAEKLFRYGNKTLDNTLTARLNAEQTQENLIQSRLAHAQTMLGLYKALGGGWSIDSKGNTR